MPRTYDKVLKLGGGRERKSTSAHNNNIYAGVEMVQYGGPGSGDQGGRDRGIGQEEEMDKAAVQAAAEAEEK